MVIGFIFHAQSIVVLTNVGNVVYVENVHEFVVTVRQPVRPFAFKDGSEFCGSGLKRQSNVGGRGKEEAGAASRFLRSVEFLSTYDKIKVVINY